MSTPVKIAAAAATLGVVIATAVGFLPPPSSDPTELVTIAPGRFDYRQSGEFLRDRVPVNAPLVAMTIDRPLAIMRHHVSRADYQRCVVAVACRPIAQPNPSNGASLPAVGVNWHDASAYAAWLSRETGETYRLPTDAEWAFAAGFLFRDTMVVAEGSAANPAARWIATYESQSAAEAVDPRPRPFASFGLNENGLADVGGNVWDWTSTCYVRHSAAADGSASQTESCGVRVVEGRHRSYLTDFIRDPKGGSCSVGTPPANLGIRLVRDGADSVAERIARAVRSFFSRAS